MDSDHKLSAAEAARCLGTSLPRVKRAIDRLGLSVEQRSGGRVRISAEQFERLRQDLGTAAPIPGLTRSEARALAALARAPLGVTSARALAARAVVSPTTATRAVDSLARTGLVRRETVWLAAGRAREVELIRANYASQRWPEVAPHLAHVSPPARAGSAPCRARPARVPHRLRHLFWNTAPAQLDVDRAGGYIARRLVQTGDLEGLAWGAEHLRPEDWQHAASARGLRAEDRALARNLAGVD
jgi:hypothetical protein